MTDKTKGHAGWHQETPNTSKIKRNFTVIASRIKALIITLALWGWLPMGIADWAINWGVQRDE